MSESNTFVQPDNWVDEITDSEPEDNNEEEGKKDESVKSVKASLEISTSEDLYLKILKEDGIDIQDVKTKKKTPAKENERKDEEDFNLYLDNIERKLEEDSHKRKVHHKKEKAVKKVRSRHNTTLSEGELISDDDSYIADKTNKRKSDKNVLTDSDFSLSPDIETINKRKLTNDCIIVSTSNVQPILNKTHNRHHRSRQIYVINDSDCEYIGTDEHRITPPHKIKITIPEQHSGGSSKEHYRSHSRDGKTSHNFRSHRERRDYKLREHLDIDDDFIKRKYVVENEKSRNEEYDRMRNEYKHSSHRRSRREHRSHNYDHNDTSSDEDYRNRRSYKDINTRKRSRSYEKYKKHGRHDKVQHKHKRTAESNHHDNVSHDYFMEPEYHGSDKSRIKNIKKKYNEYLKYVKKYKDDDNDSKHIENFVKIRSKRKESPVRTSVSSTIDDDEDLEKLKQEEEKYFKSLEMYLEKKKEEQMKDGSKLKSNETGLKSLNNEEEYNPENVNEEEEYVPEDFTPDENITLTNISLNDEYDPTSISFSSDTSLSYEPTKIDQYEPISQSLTEEYQPKPISPIKILTYCPTKKTLISRPNDVISFQPISLQKSLPPNQNQYQPTNVFNQTSSIQKTNLMQNKQFLLKQRVFPTTRDLSMPNPRYKPFVTTPSQLGLKQITSVKPVASTVITTNNSNKTEMMKKLVNEKLSEIERKKIELLNEIKKCSKEVETNHNTSTSSADPLIEKQVLEEKKRKLAEHLMEMKQKILELEKKTILMGNKENQSTIEETKKNEVVQPINKTLDKSKLTIKLNELEKKKAVLKEQLDKKLAEKMVDKSKLNVQLNELEKKKAALKEQLDKKLAEKNKINTNIKIKKEKDESLNASIKIKEEKDKDGTQSSKSQQSPISSDKNAFNQSNENNMPSLDNENPQNIEPIDPVIEVQKDKPIIVKKEKEDITTSNQTSINDINHEVNNQNIQEKESFLSDPIIKTSTEVNIEPSNVSSTERCNETLIGQVIQSNEDNTNMAKLNKNQVAVVKETRTPIVSKTLLKVNENNLVAIKKEKSSPIVSKTQLKVNENNLVAIKKEKSSPIVSKTQLKVNENNLVAIKKETSSPSISKTIQKVNENNLVANIKESSSPSISKTQLHSKKLNTVDINTKLNEIEKQRKELLLEIKKKLPITSKDNNELNSNKKTKIVEIENRDEGLTNACSDEIIMNTENVSIPNSTLVFQEKVNISNGKSPLEINKKIKEVQAEKTKLMEKIKNKEKTNTVESLTCRRNLFKKKYSEMEKQLQDQMKKQVSLLNNHLKKKNEEVCINKETNEMISTKTISDNSNEKLDSSINDMQSNKEQNNTETLKSNIENKTDLKETTKSENINKKLNEIEQQKANLLNKIRVLNTTIAVAKPLVITTSATKPAISNEIKTTSNEVILHKNDNIDETSNKTKLFSLKVSETLSEIEKKRMELLKQIERKTLRKSSIDIDDISSTNTSLNAIENTQDIKSNVLKSCENKEKFGKQKQCYSDLQSFKTGKLNYNSTTPGEIIDIKQEPVQVDLKSVNTELLINVNIPATVTDVITTQQSKPSRSRTLFSSDGLFKIPHTPPVSPRSSSPLSSSSSPPPLTSSPPLKGVKAISARNKVKITNCIKTSPLARKIYTKRRLLLKRLQFKMDKNDCVMTYHNSMKRYTKQDKTKYFKKYLKMAYINHVSVGNGCGTSNTSQQNEKNTKKIESVENENEKISLSQQNENHRRVMEFYNHLFGKKNFEAINPSPQNENNSSMVEYHNQVPLDNERETINLNKENENFSRTTDNLNQVNNGNKTINSSPQNENNSRMLEWHNQISVDNESVLNEEDENDSRMMGYHNQASVENETINSSQVNENITGIHSHKLGSYIQEMITKYTCVQSHKGHKEALKQLDENIKSLEEIYKNSNKNKTVLESITKLTSRRDGMLQMKSSDTDVVQSNTLEKNMPLCEVKIMNHIIGDTMSNTCGPSTSYQDIKQQPNEYYTYLPDDKNIPTSSSVTELPLPSDGLIKDNTLSNLESLEQLSNRISSDSSPNVEKFVKIEGIKKVNKKTKTKIKSVNNYNICDCTQDEDYISIRLNCITVGYFKVEKTSDDNKDKRNDDNNDDQTNKEENGSKNKPNSNNSSTQKLKNINDKLDNENEKNINDNDEVIIKNEDIDEADDDDENINNKEGIDETIKNNEDISKVIIRNKDLGDSNRDVHDENINSMEEIELSGENEEEDDGIEIIILPSKTKEPIDLITIDDDDDDVVECDSNIDKEGRKNKINIIQIDDNDDSDKCDKNIVINDKQEDKNKINTTNIVVNNKRKLILNHNKNIIKTNDTNKKISKYKIIKYDQTEHIPIKQGINSLKLKLIKTDNIENRNLKIVRNKTKTDKIRKTSNKKLIRKTRFKINNNTNKIKNIENKIDNIKHTNNEQSQNVTSIKRTRKSSKNNNKKYNIRSQFKIINTKYKKLNNYKMLPLSIRRHVMNKFKLQNTLITAIKKTPDIKLIKKSIPIEDSKQIDEEINKIKTPKIKLSFSKILINDNKNITMKRTKYKIRKVVNKTEDLINSVKKSKYKIRRNRLKVVNKNEEMNTSVKKSKYKIRRNRLKIVNKNDRIKESYLKNKISSSQSSKNKFSSTTSQSSSKNKFSSTASQSSKNKYRLNNKEEKLLSINSSQQKSKILISKYKVVRTCNQRERNRLNLSNRRLDLRNSNKTLKFINLNGTSYTVGTRSLKRKRSESADKVNKSLPLCSSYTKKSGSSTAASSYSKVPLTSSNIFTNRSIIGRHQLASSRLRSLAVLSSRLRKNNMICPVYKRYGSCRKKSTCHKVHDPKHIRICPRFIKGQCVEADCKLSHCLSASNTPACHHYQIDSCTRDNCPYLHVKYQEGTPICTDFVNGFCKLSQECTKKHIHKSYKEYNKSRQHRKRRRDGSKSKYNIDSTTTSSPCNNKSNYNRSSKCKYNNDDDSNSSDDNEDTRYFDNNEKPSSSSSIPQYNDSDDDCIESVIPKRVRRVGTLPGYIPL